jgi:hypothetical protein
MSVFTPKQISKSNIITEELLSPEYSWGDSRYLNKDNMRLDIRENVLQLVKRYDERDLESNEPFLNDPDNFEYVKKIVTILFVLKDMDNSSQKRYLLVQIFDKLFSLLSS